ncbi:MAG: hypothetical protein ACD_57C00044G0001, partial [uncultured bacterium]
KRGFDKRGVGITKEALVKDFSDGPHGILKFEERKIPSPATVRLASLAHQTKYGLFNLFSNNRSTHHVTCFGSSFA